MKTKLIITIAVLCALCTGCKKHECEKLSWTNYNSVEDVHCNFTYFQEECMTHLDDTLRVYGWLHYNDGFSQWITMTSNKDLQFNNNSSLLYSYPFVDLFVSNQLYNSLIQNNLYDTLAYVTGVVRINEPPYDLFLLANKIENTPDYEK